MSSCAEAVSLAGSTSSSCRVSFYIQEANADRGALQVSFESLVRTVLQARTFMQRRGGNDVAQSGLLCARSGDLHRDFMQHDRLARVDGHANVPVPAALTRDQLRIDLRLVVAERAQRLAHLAIHAVVQALHCVGIQVVPLAVARQAEEDLDVALNFLFDALDLDLDIGARSRLCQQTAPHDNEGLQAVANEALDPRCQR